MASGIDRAHGLAAIGLTRSDHVQWNLSAAALYEAAIRRGEGFQSESGAFVTRTGPYAGRIPDDKLIVREASSERHVYWSSVNRPLDETLFEALRRDMMRYLGGEDLFVIDAWAGAHPKHRLPIRLVNELAWHGLFARNMFITDDDPHALENHCPELTVIDAPHFKANPAKHGTRSETFVVLHLTRKLALIGGIRCAAEVRNAIFTLLNYTLSLQGVLSMHCSANVDRNGETTLFFGLPGTAKTTLAASDSERHLVGDDEHGWSDDGVFNCEGGCYAKVADLSARAQPELYAATRRVGTILEYVVVNRETRALDVSPSEHVCAWCPISFIERAELFGLAGHPKNIMMLTADAHGVLPPIARLTPAGAMYHFLSGYTARVEHTEGGVAEPKAMFSACFGAPFLPLNPNVYARMLGEKIVRHDTKVWLVNTGCTGGPHGVGNRIHIAYTRAMISAALTGQLDTVQYQRHAIFNIDVPVTCPGVPTGILDARGTWPDGRSYDRQATKLARMFVENFEAFETDVATTVKQAGPTV